jgi:small subunit ribosomal protein S1
MIYDKSQFKYTFINHEISSKCISFESNETKENYENFEKLLKKYVIRFDVGDRASGKVVSICSRSVLIDMGLKDYAILPFNEISIKGGHAEDLLTVGETREFLVIRSTNREVQLTVSLKAIEMEMAWQRAREHLNSDSIIDVQVLEATKGGFRVSMEGQTSFLPVSQISPKYLNDQLIGRTIPVKLVDVDESKNRCVCSNRKAVIEEGNAMSTLADIKVGDVVQGYVQNLTAFGAFVDLNGVVGLLHVSQISNDRICSVEGIFLIGEPIKCMVLAVDKDKGRLSLTTKKLEPSPGDMLRNRELVMERAEDMAQLFRERVAAAEAALRAVEENKSILSTSENIE